MRRTAIRGGIVLAGLLFAQAAQAETVSCGGDFATWKRGLQAELTAAGHVDAAVQQFLHDAAIDPKVLAADQRQGVFRRSFSDFSSRLISKNRLETAAKQRVRQGDLLARAAADYGVPPGIILAFWGLETDFGAVQGDFNTLNALVTLAHDCRRPGLFRPQIAAAFQLWQRGDLDPARTTGAWAGEIGQVQMLPRDLLMLGVDGDGDGRVDLKGSVADALLSGARLLQSHGWQAGQPWLTEVQIPEDLDFEKSGLHQSLSGAEWQAMGVAPRKGELPADLQASLLLPEGHRGVAFLVWPNFRILLEWNQSLVYVTSAAYFATRIEGAPVFQKGNADPGLDQPQMEALQRKLQARGHDVGKIDGILGQLTRAAVQREQLRLGLTADAWPTADLLEKL